MGSLFRTIKNIKTREYLILILFSITFEAIVLVIARHDTLPDMVDPWMVAALGFASYRAGRAIAFNRIFEWLRAPFTEIVDDSSGAGESVEPTGTGLRRMVGELLCCPVCAGTWSALILFGALILYRPMGLVLIYVLAAAGIAEILHWNSERAEWQGRAAREEAGTNWLLKNKGKDFREPVTVVFKEQYESQTEHERVYVWQGDLFEERGEQVETPFSQNGHT